MRIFNADGSEAMMCGNASRCIGKYLYERGLTDKTEIRLETLSGVKTLHLHVSPQRQVDAVTVDMGVPTLIRRVELGAGYPFGEGIALSMGNPHLVIFVDDAESVDLPGVGPLLEHHPLFPHRVNVEFAQITGDAEIRMRVWERGSGITQACGTGACATAVAASLHPPFASPFGSADGRRHAADSLERGRRYRAHDWACRERVRRRNLPPRISPSQRTVTLPQAMPCATHSAGLHYG